MSSASEGLSTHGDPSQEVESGKQERKNTPGGGRSNKHNEGNEKKGGAGRSMESGSRNKRRDLGRAEWRYVCNQYPSFSPD